MRRNPKRASCTVGLEYKTRPLVPASLTSRTRGGTPLQWISAQRGTSAETLWLRPAEKVASSFNLSNQAHPPTAFWSSRTQ